MTLDDMWRLDLSKMDGWTCIKVGPHRGALLPLWHEWSLSHGTFQQ